MRILIVDDDLDFCEELADLLRHYGHDCLCIGDGSTALETVREFGRPNLILLDLGLPVMDGFEFRRRQLADPEIADIPVFVISGYHLNGAWRHQLQAQGYFAKPVRVSELIGAIDALRQ